MRPQGRIGPWASKRAAAKSEDAMRKAGLAVGAMPDPTPRLEAANERETAVERKLARGAYALIDSTLAAQRALLAEWLAEHDAHWCQACAANDYRECQLAERTRRLGVEGEE